jgi:hypothetical protein
MLLLLALPLFADDVIDGTPPGYKEVPYYVRKLEETKLEDERVKFGKLIHDGIVNADLSDKRVVREMEATIERIQKDMDSGLDRMSITGQSNWLASAVDYFEREKLKPIIDIPESDWLPDQSKTDSGLALSTFPDKILIHRNGQPEKIVDHTQIHEAVISPDGRRIAYYRLIAEGSPKAEIWTANIATKKKKRLATVESCYTLLYSLDGDRLFYQAQPAKPEAESDIFYLSGKKGKKITTGRLLETVVSKGRYAGDLIVFKAHLHHLGVSRLSCPYAVTESGSVVGRLVNGPCK